MANLLLRATEWNPQLFREVKGRLKRLPIAIAVAASLAVQGLMLVYFWKLLPHPYSLYHRYYSNPNGGVGGEQILDALGQPIINWQLWWSDIFQALSWLLPLILLLAGTYGLIADLAKEEQRGTLNFIRLSPQTSQSILLGKALGVPILSIVAVATAIPLHLIAAIMGNMGVGSVLSLYLLTIAACAFFYTMALFFVLQGATQPGVGPIVVSAGYFLFALTYNHFYYSYDRPYYGWHGQWFYAWIGESLASSVGFAVMILGVGTFWLWQSVNRRFRNPNRTLISKTQSYGLTACVQLFLFGFVLRQTSPGFEHSGDLMALLGMNLLWFLIIIATLTPQRQTLLDWARFRHVPVTELPQHPRSKVRRSLRQDLLWGESSPALLAIAVNLLIPIGLFTPWILSWLSSDSFRAAPQLRAFSSLLIFSLFLLICAVVVQLFMLSQFNQRGNLAIGVTAGLIAIPPLLLALLHVYGLGTIASALWLFTAIGFIPLLAQVIPPMTVLLSCIGYLGLFTLLTQRLVHRLRQVGASEFNLITAGR
ncbi:hypothetical protein ACN4EK_27230 [Pantanalinema rosaneae CENA516]|uniref:hypothetical protein n=1 Tax=Pantanalinema rosaneae TaxID=1620701 RepID=UPI003D6FDEC0